jgi:rhomboid protease GluP
MNDMSDQPPAAAPPAGLDRGRDRLLAAMVAVADKRGITLLPSTLPDLPWITLVALPDQGAGVALLERGEVTAEELRGRLDRVLGAHAQGVMYLVLVGGSNADRATLLAADRQAPDPDRLGVYHLDHLGRLDRVAGRRSGLLADAAHLVAQAAPLDPAALEGLAERTRREQQEASAFASALEKRPQVATRVLGAVCILYYVLAQMWGSGGGYGETLLRMGGNSAPLVAAGEVWRLVSYAFLHGNFFHLLVNLIALLSFGSFLEGLIGWRRYLLLYGLTALVGGMASALLAGVVLSVGASGAIWGLMGAGLGLAFLRRGDTPLPRAVATRLRPRLMGVLVLNSVFSLLPLFLPGMGKIDLFAHAGGGLVGFLLAASGLLTRGLGAPDAREPAGVRAGAAAVILVLAASLALALITGQPWLRVGAI